MKREEFCRAVPPSRVSDTDCAASIWTPAWARIIDVPTSRHRKLRASMRHTLEHLKTAAEASGAASPRR